MAGAMSARQYRFSQAAEIIGISRAALRNWMTRNQLDLFDERPANGWRSFSENDVMILALAAKLVAFGASVDDAVMAAKGVLTNMGGHPMYYWAAPSRFGGWIISDEDAVVQDAAIGGAVIRVTFT
ncbi:hypothetical protein GCM10007897_15000 [Sphingobium jiangsuense]|uniref:HTH merR-type domain-containing protein n=1 Tax=Sphingobium jiangsuense TaxID=870476 RepID=A0A7W6BDS7_9SPHN|nr:MerR family transcriptional regulator [Sphingobium jiangsuense]MBB3925055.1 hypothetical protein [Sphingobium jiangsuense]GLT00116.1 hypothetical protein GCM10007897_15000 [Sphingobium jiangsuense]